MTVAHEDLVALALGALDGAEADRVGAAAAADPDAQALLDAVRRHLALHDRAPEVLPAPALWEGLRGRLDEAVPPRPLLLRFWMPAAAAALVLAAFFLPRPQPPEPVAVFGRLERAGDSYAAAGVARVRVDGVTVTLDDGTTIVPLSSERLALRAGRAFFDVPARGRGFRVVAGDVTATVTGTAFLAGIDRGAGFVLVESGEVRCERAGEAAVLGPGGSFGAAPFPAARARAWFARPSITATILDGTAVRVVIRNEMPDPIEMAPPTGGEPFFFVTYGGRDHPLTPEGLHAPLVLAPGEERAFEARLPRPLGPDERLVLSWPWGDLRVEAAR